MPPEIFLPSPHNPTLVLNRNNMNIINLNNQCNGVDADENANTCQQVEKGRNGI